MRNEVAAASPRLSRALAGGGDIDAMLRAYRAHSAAEYVRQRPVKSRARGGLLRPLFALFHAAR